MRHVHPRGVVEKLRRSYPEPANVWIAQVYKDRYGWTNVNYPLREIGRLYDAKYTKVQFRLLSLGKMYFPDYDMEELVTEFLWRPLDWLEINVNQGIRKACVLAVIGDEALIEYEMPQGTTALWVIDARKPYPHKLRNLGYNSCPQKWLRAMEEAGTIWENNPQ